LGGGGGLGWEGSLLVEGGGRVRERNPIEYWIGSVFRSAKVGRESKKLLSGWVVMGNQRSLERAMVPRIRCPGRFWILQGKGSLGSYSS